MIGRLLGVATVGSALINVGLLRRFLEGVANVVILAIVSAFMLCLVLAGLFYGAYEGLVHYGLDPYVAGIVVGLVVLALTVTLVAFTFRQLRRLHELPHHAALRPNAGLMPELANVADAFIDGFLHPGK